MRNAVIRFGNSANAVPYLASFGNEVVVRIDHKKCSDVPIVSDFCHRASDLCRPSQGVPGQHYARSDLKAARTSCEKSCGCSQAA